jgi:hypothetical protein
MLRVVQLAAVLAVLAPSAARAACPPGGELIAENRRAIVIQRGDAVYACTGKLRRLPLSPDGLRAKLHGLHGAFATGDSIVVLNLRTGKRERGYDTASGVRAFRIGSHGYVAWTENDGALYAAAGWRRLVDRGPVTALALDRGFLRWTHDGAPRVTELDAGRFRGTCDRLSGREVLRTDGLLIVSRPYRRRGPDTIVRGRELLGCALPAGVVHRLGLRTTEVLRDGGDLYGRESLSFSRPAGRYVLARSTGSYRDSTSAELTAIDTETGVGVDAWSFFDDGVGVEFSPTREEPRGVALSDAGVVAGVYSSDFKDELIAFAASGRKVVLDSGDVGDGPGGRAAGTRS